MRTSGVGLVALYVIALIAAVTMPVLPGGETILQMVAASHKPLVWGISALLLLIPVALVGFVFKQTKQLEEWAFTQKQMQKDLDRTVKVLVGLGKTQEAVAAGVYKAGGTDVVGEAEKIAVSMKGSEARLIALEQAIAEGGKLEEVLAQARARQEATLARLAKVNTALEPIRALSTGLAQKRAEIEKVFIDLGQINWAEKAASDCTQQEAYATRAEARIATSETALAKFRDLQPRLESLRTRAISLAGASGVMATLQSAQSLQAQIEKAFGGIESSAILERTVADLHSTTAVMTKRVDTIEQIIPQSTAERSQLHALSLRMRPLLSETSGVKALIAETRTAMKEIEQLLVKAELDEKGVPVPRLIADLKAQKDAHTSRIDQVEANLRGLVGLNAEYSLVGSRLNGAAPAEKRA